MKWKRVVASAEGKKWTDWVSSNGKYRVEQGRDTFESRRGRPWLLLRVTKKGVHARVDAFESLEAAQLYAGERESERQINKAARQAGV